MLRVQSVASVLMLATCSLPVLASEQYDACLLAKIHQASADTTVQVLREACREPTVATDLDVSVPAPGPAVVAKPAPNGDRPKGAERVEAQTFSIASHRPNYLLLASFNEQRPDSAPFARDHSTETTEAQKVEAKYQLSIRAPLVSGLLDGNGSLHAAYTQRSFWQVYNRRASAPFRETDYEPEVWYQHATRRALFGWTLNNVMLGFNHQSNGRAKDFSRSWNRVFAAVELKRDNLSMVLRPWVRISEDPSNDDNRDITHYLGNFDLVMSGKAGKQSWDLMVRNNLHRHGNRGAVQFGWSFPLSERFRGYVQWFKGYGESLIDYNSYQNTVGVGVRLSDW